MEELTEKALKAGKEFTYDNFDYQLSIEGDDLRAADVLFRTPQEGYVYPGEFHLWFNGQLIHTCKTFKSLQNRLNKLIADLNLKLTAVD